MVSKYMYDTNEKTISWFVFTGVPASSDEAFLRGGTETDQGHSTAAALQN